MVSDTAEIQLSFPVVHLSAFLFSGSDFFVEFCFDNKKQLSLTPLVASTYNRLF